MMKCYKIGKNEIIFIIMLFIIISILVSSYFIIPQLAKAETAESMGQFGDQFGVVNALFSGLAFAGLIYTILLQKDELKAQREELSFTRDEIRGQKEELELQNSTLTLQRFETTFFNMLSQHNEMVRNQTYLPTSDNPLVGKEVIRYFVAKKKGFFGSESGLINVICTTITTNNISRDVDKLAQINVYYDKVYNKRPNFFGVYYRSLYRIFVFIDNSKIDNKEMYSDIIRSQLSDDEITMLLVNGLAEKGQKFKKYIEQYALLDNLSGRDDISAIKSLYLPSAYGE